MLDTPQTIEVPYHVTCEQHLNECHVVLFGLLHHRVLGVATLSDARTCSLSNRLTGTTTLISRSLGVRESIGTGVVQSAPGHAPSRVFGIEHSSRHIAFKEFGGPRESGGYAFTSPGT